jgi:hypothetical protein
MLTTCAVVVILEVFDGEINCWFLVPMKETEQNKRLEQSG